MAKKTAVPKYVTRENLREEIATSELRLEAKIETTAQSLKDYTDSRFTQLDTRLGGVERSLDAKLTKYFELMMQAFTEGHKGIYKILSSHEERISILEGKGGSPGRT
ncbi:MAG: hypothetical protein WBW71_06410 [Bacteroidota bacterium]